MLKNQCFFVQIFLKKRCRCFTKNMLNFFIKIPLFRISCFLQHENT